jgi:hypothetical protein
MFGFVATAIDAISVPWLNPFLDNQSVGRVEEFVPSISDKPFGHEDHCVTHASNTILSLKIGSEVSNAVSKIAIVGDPTVLLDKFAALAVAGISSTRANIAAVIFLFIVAIILNTLRSVNTTYLYLI